jgi:signal transduction histidine kinase
MFQSAVRKLTLYYLIIIMLLSFGFSTALYVALTHELGRGLQKAIVFDLKPFDGLAPSPQRFEEFRQQQLAAARQRVLNDLLFYNLSILGLAGVASYYLAKRTLEPIQAAHEAQGRFTADASHELRTPLTAMRTELEVALRDKKLSTQEARQLLTSNLEEVVKIQGLAEGLLKLSHIDTQEVFNDWEQLVIGDVLSQAISLVQKSAAQKNIQFVKIGPLDTRLEGNSFGLIELFSILLDNAIKYSPEKSTVTLAVKKRDNHLTVVLTDAGHGIKASDIPYIFNRFYRGDASRTKQDGQGNGGYGLGLSIAKQLVELHDGQITVASQPEKGSTFTVVLPIKRSTLL